MRLGAVLFVKDDLRLAAQWLAHHSALGFTEFAIFDNGSTDGTRAMLQTAARRLPGLQLFDWHDGWDDPHRAAFAAGLACMRGLGVDWCLFSDSDEFLVQGSVAGNDVAGWLASLPPEAGAIALNWALYGSAGHVDEPPGLTVESYLRRAPDDFNVNYLTKTLLRPEAARFPRHSHGFALYPGFAYVDSRGGPVEWQDEGRIAGRPLLDGWRLNHYFCRSRAEWERKAARSRTARGFSVRTEQDWQGHDRNEMLDLTGLSYVAGLRREMTRLGLGDPA